MAALALIFSGAFVAFVISVLAGGGAGLVLIPLLGLALPAASVPGALSIGTAASSASRLAAFRSAIRWDIARWFVPAAVPFAVLGAWALTLLPPVYLELLLGLFLVGNVLFALGRDHRARRNPDRPLRPVVERPRGVLVAVGILAGFISGFTGAVGVLFNDLYLRLGLRKEEIVATRAANEIALHGVKIATYALLGVMSRDAVLVGTLVAVAALLATAVARHVLAGLDERLFRRLNYGVMGIAGVAMVAAACGEMSARHGITLRTDLDPGSVELTVRWPGSRISAEWSLDTLPKFEWKAAPGPGGAALHEAALD